MEEHVAIPYQELRGEDLKTGARVHVWWGPEKPDAVGRITRVRIWPQDAGTAAGEDYDVVIHVTDERTGEHRQASLRDEWIDVLERAEEFLALKWQ